MPVLAAALACIAFLASAVPALRAASFGVNRFQDDAFYYVVTAQHYVASGTFSFDGVTATNGFQPLWMAIVVLVLKLLGAGAQPVDVVLAIVVVERICLAAAVALAIAFFVRACRDDAPWRSGFLATAVVLLCPWYVVFEQGMETTLAACVFVIVVRLVVAKRPVALGIALAVLFLCRLDAGVFVGVPILAWLVFRRDWPARTRLAATLPLVAVMLADVTVNYALTGHTVPISGAIKSSFPRITFHGGYFVEPFVVMQLYGWRTLAYTLNVVTVAGVALAGFALLPLVRFAQRGACTLVGVVAVLLLANLLLFQQWEKSVDPRYLALPMLAAVFFTGSVIDAWSRRFGKRFAPYALTAVLAVEGAAWIVRAPPAWNATTDPVASLFAEVRAALPRDAVLAGTDVGALAFWTGHRVVNLDGVISNFDYQDRLRDGQLADYLRAQDVTHIATALWDREQSYTARPAEPMYRHQVDAAAQRGEAYDCHAYYVYSYVHHVYSDRLCLRASDEVYRRDLGLDGVAQTSYVVYRMPQ